MYDSPPAPELVWSVPYHAVRFSPGNDNPFRPVDIPFDAVQLPLYTTPGSESSMNIDGGISVLI